MDNERDNLVKALREVASGSRRSKTARLREIFEDVEAAKSKGASNKQIVAALEAHGLFFDVNNFKNARSRILKERAMEALKNASPAPEEKPAQRPIKKTHERKAGTAVAVTANAAPSKTKQVVAGTNPLAGLGGVPKDGEFSPIPTTNFEVDNS